MRRIRAEVRCYQCGFTARQDAIDLLRRAGMLKRAGDDVDEHLVLALLTAAGKGLECSNCGHAGMECSESENDEEGDWPSAGPKSCRGCSQPIEIERLQLFPDNEYCVTCQQQRENGVAADDQREFCPWCGQVLTHKATRRRGVTEYVPACPACGYVG